ncbi:hypothetical protein CRG98_048814, partial [Punica granatum]
MAAVVENLIEGVAKVALDFMELVLVGDMPHNKVSRETPMLVAMQVVTMHFDAARITVSRVGSRGGSE